LKVYSEADARPSILENKTIVVAGYGNQGRPQALNLRDSGFDVTVAAREDGMGSRLARQDGFTVLSLAEGARRADVLLLLLPDEIQGDVFRADIAGKLRSGAALCFAHGFSIAFGEIGGDAWDIVLVAPKGQGERLRGSYLEGSGLPCLVSVAHDATGTGLQIALAIAWGLGCLRVGAFETTFKEEAVSDLFGEQAVLCGGVPALIKTAFETLMRHGFSPEVAYFECLHELKIIVDIFTRLGFSGMRDLISGTASYGSLRYGEELVSRETEEAMENLFKRIESGEFARDWLSVARSGRGELDSLHERERNLLIEEVGARIRKLFPDTKE
jgi:ketol-acid reductoisomerase